MKPRSRKNVRTLQLPAPLGAPATAVWEMCTAASWQVEGWKWMHLCIWRSRCSDLILAPYLETGMENVHIWKSVMKAECRHFA